MSCVQICRKTGVCTSVHNFICCTLQQETDKKHYFENTCNSKASISWSYDREKVCSMSVLLKLLAILVTHLKRLAPLIVGASCSTDIIMLLYSKLILYAVFPLLHLILCFLC